MLHSSHPLATIRPQHKHCKHNQPNQELQVERERQQRLERDLRRQQQMMDENNASMQVELSIESMPTVAHDELVTSYLKAADTYGSIVTERKTVAKALTTIQNDLIERRNEEAQLLTLREKHFIDCKNTHNLQAAQRRAKQYRELWSQQHQVLRELERAILELCPTALRSDTLLEGVQYQRMLARNFGLQRAWVQMNRERSKRKKEAAALAANGDSEAATVQKDDGAKRQQDEENEQASTDQPSCRAPTMQEAAMLATLAERKKSLRAQINAAKQKHREEMEALQQKLKKLQH